MKIDMSRLGRMLCMLIVLLSAFSLVAAESFAAKGKGKKKEKKSQAKIAAKAAVAAEQLPIYNPPREQIPPPGFRPPTAENVADRPVPIFNPPPTQEFPRGFNPPRADSQAGGEAWRDSAAAHVRALKAERAELVKAGALADEMKALDEQIQSLERTLKAGTEGARGPRVKEALSAAKGQKSAVAAQEALDAASKAR